MSKKFLIVDDSLVSRMMTRSTIGKLRPEWKYFEACNGEQALSICQANEIDLACIDLNMPGMNGIEVAVLMRNHWPAIAITIMTANIQSSVQDKIQKNGFSFMPKPLTDNKGPELLKVLGD